MQTSNTDGQKTRKTRYASTYTSKPVTLRLPNKIVQKIGWKAAEEEVTSNEIIRQILTDAVKDAKPPITLEYRRFAASDSEWQRWQDLADHLRVDLSELLRQVLNRLCDTNLPK
jgi:hypothetical protein